MKYIGIIVAVIVLGAVGLFVLGGESDTMTSDASQSTTTTAEQALVTEAIDESLTKFVEEDSIEYKNAISFTGSDYDQYFIANMIHYSEGLAQLETMAEKSTNTTISTGAAERTAQATSDIAMYKNLQKEMGQPVSYGQGMQYHAAMGADAEVYFAVSSIEGLSGTELESELAEQLKYFYRAETLLAGAGLNNANDEQIKELITQTLQSNAVMLQKI